MNKWNSSPSPEISGRIMLILLAVASLYFVVAETRYRFRHPELTETQLFLKLGDTILWRD